MQQFDLDIIEQYLSGQMEKEKALAFEVRLRENKALEREVSFHRDILHGIEYHGQEVFKENVRSIEETLEQEGFFADEEEKALLGGMEHYGRQQFEQSASEIANELEAKGFFEKEIREAKPIKGKSVRLPLRRILTIAASFLLMILAGWLLFRSPAQEGLFANYFHPPEDRITSQIELELTETGFADNEKTFLEALQRIMILYRSAQYERVINNLEALLQQYPSTSKTEEASFYLAIAHLASGQAEAAKNLLLPLTRRASKANSTEAKWYLSLAHLQIQEIDQSLIILESLVPHPKYGNQAKALLKEMINKN